MGEIYTPLSPSTPRITVHFYGSNIHGSHLFATPPHIITQELLPLTCEQVCMLSAQHLSSNLGRFFPPDNWDRIGPDILPMFGLYAADHSLQQWVPDAHIFDSSISNLQFYFRVKVRPAMRESITEGMFTHYLCEQCCEDFLAGRMWSQFGVDIKIKDVKDVSKKALWIHMAFASYLKDTHVSRPETLLHSPLKDITTLECIRGKLTLVGVHRLLPKKMSPELGKQYNITSKYSIPKPFMRIESKSLLHTLTKNFFEKWKEDSLSLMRRCLVDDFLSSVPYYLLEYFPAGKVENYRASQSEKEEDRGPLPSTPVELVIRPHQDGCAPGLYFNKKFKVHLRDIIGAEISEWERVQAENRTCHILLKIQHRQPMILDLPNQAAAKSFLSVLETYWRLKYNYYDSLNTEQLAAPTLRVLKDLRAFGPMEEETARRFLQEQKKNDKSLAQCEAFYILYQDAQDFGLLHATGLRQDAEGLEIVSYDIRYTINPASPAAFSCTMKVGEEEKSFTDTMELGYFLTTTLNLGQRKFYAEGILCGAMRFVQDEDVSENIYSYVGMQSERTGRQGREDMVGDQPMMYREDQIDLTGAALIHSGKFSDVYRFQQMKLGREAILRNVTGKSAVQNAYKKGADLLLKLRDHCHFFVRVYGLVIPDPTRIVYECMPEGNRSLLERLRDDTAPHLNWLQVASVLKQLAECLCSLKEAKMVYGSFCCAKILIWKEKDTALTIRLGDPGLALYYDTLPVDDAHNDRRIPWLAPERWLGMENGRGALKLSKASISSEVYSLGTTIWEVICRGLDPIQCIPHGTKVKDFFEEGNKLPDPVFKQGMATHGDVSSLLVNAHNRTGMNQGQQRVEGQDFAHNVAQSDNHMEDDIDDYNRVTLPDSEPGSNQVSGDTVITNLSGESAGRYREQSRPTIPETETCKIQDKMLRLMHDCWHDDPHQRPAPLTLMKAAWEVEQLAEKAITDCSPWNLQQILRIALENNSLQPTEEVKQLQQQAQKAQAMGQAGQSEEKYSKVVRELEQQVSQRIDSVIDPTLLTFEGDNTPAGKGEHGAVRVAYLEEASETREAEAAARKKKEKVAVKTILKHQSPSQMVQLLKEALNVYGLEHHNVVKLKGITLKGYCNPNIQLVMEFADKGDLEKYAADQIKKLDDLAYNQEMQSLALDIARGMQYIDETMKMVHGDLAARNVLLFSSGGTGSKPFTAKLGDFGLSHKLQRGQKGIYYYDIKQSICSNAAICWMPCETIENWNERELKFTIKTDVWSFGVTLWEMFSAKDPQGQLNRKQLALEELIIELDRVYKRGERLPKLPNFPVKVYSIMQQCWKQDDTGRPNFTALIEMIEKLEEIDLKQSQD